MLYNKYDNYIYYWYSIWSLCVSIKCKSCTCEMQHVSQGLTNYEWYKDYYCPTCKKLIVILDKDHKQQKLEIGVKV